jgi:hypothetical protein
MIRDQVLAAMAVAMKEALVRTQTRRHIMVYAYVYAIESSEKSVLLRGHVVGACDWETKRFERHPHFQSRGSCGAWGHYCPKHVPTESTRGINSQGVCLGCLEEWRTSLQEKYQPEPDMDDLFFGVGD